jgi:phosphonate metabolism protein PhnN/1,5-bisphosphokinase (PRPP-forming)
MSPRYALYFAPRADSPWNRFAQRWLGRCAITGERHAVEDVPGVTASRYTEIVAEPARYGFHATLKAPFRLRSDAVPGTLISELERLCSRIAPFRLHTLEPRRLADFIALVPAYDDARVAGIAEDCVRSFEPLRAASSVQELQRRRQAGLTERQETLLVTWGYPYVMDQYRFHLTLTGALDRCTQAEVDALLDAARRRLPAEPLEFDSVCVFREPAPGAPFELMHRAPFARRGRLVYLVGPSGAGKDSLIRWVKLNLPPGAPVEFARRTITREPGPDGEPHHTVDATAFDQLRNEGRFSLAWQANGHGYGIGKEVHAWLKRGLTVVVNGSREHLPEALRTFPGLEVVHVTAPAAILNERLSARGRESAAEIEGRLARGTFEAPADVPFLEIRNDRELESAGRVLRAMLLGQLPLPATGGAP